MLEFFRDSHFWSIFIYKEHTLSLSLKSIWVKRKVISKSNVQLKAKVIELWLKSSIKWQNEIEIILLVILSSYYLNPVGM